MQDLIWFNKEGDGLNFRYDSNNEKWSGSLIFDSNSDDTFKTIGIYLFERIPSFEYENPSIMQLRKFQLFNEFKFIISGSSYMTQSVSRVSLPNTDSSFYSKWIYGIEFEKKFPIGSQIVFDTSFLEFNSKNRTYTVVKTKKDAILILSSVNNKDFSSRYGQELVIDPNSGNLPTISGVNSVGIYNYVDKNFKDTQSSWSEPGFYDYIYESQRFNLINTNHNNGVYTVNNTGLLDRVYNRSKLDISSITQSSNLFIDIVLKDDLPTVYSGKLIIEYNRIILDRYESFPKILKPGVLFSIPESKVNTNFFEVDNVINFDTITSSKKFNIDDQILFNNRIYQCILSYTWSATSSISPTSSSYWRLSNYIPVSSTLIPETFNYTELHLTTNHFTYSYPFTQSAFITANSAIQKFNSELNFLGIDLSYDSSESLFADLIYPTEYAIVSMSMGSQSSFTEKIYEKNIGVKESLTPEINTNRCSNFSYEIVFTDIDSFGIKITINGQIYYQEVYFLYDGLNVNLDRTIDATLRNWLTNWYMPLVSMGIIVKLKYIGKFFSSYFNSIEISTEYPNVPLVFKVEVGTTANFYIERSDVSIIKIGNYFALNINGVEYAQKVISSNGVADIPTTVKNWVNTYYPILYGYGIVAYSYLNLISFKVLSQSTKFNLVVKTGVSTFPGDDSYLINDKFPGKFGSLLSSNQVILNSATYSFEDYQFATGQLVSVNNSSRPLNNKEYNIEGLTPQSLVLSYQGPFWSSEGIFCEVSPFLTIALSSGFGATGCSPSIPHVDHGGDFNHNNYSNSFLIIRNNNNTYTVSQTSNLPQTSVFNDIIYLGISNKIYILGSDLTILDSSTGEIIQNIKLPNDIGTSISLDFNEHNNYLYSLSEYGICVINPIYPCSLYYTINLGKKSSNFKINQSTGDVYVSYGDQTIEIWTSSNFSGTQSYTITNSSSNFYDLQYNKSDLDIYSTGDDIVFKIDGTSRSILESYSIPSVGKNIFYEPSYSAMYVFGTSSLWRINNGISTNINNSISSSNPKNLVFDTINQSIFISSPDGILKLNLDGGYISQISSVEYGPLTINQFDGDLYLASQYNKSLFVIDSNNLLVKFSANFPQGNIKKTIYNPDRESIFGIVPSGVFEQQSIFEIGVKLASKVEELSPTYSIVGENNYGTLDPAHIPHIDLWIKTREYIRRPRENYIGYPYVNYIWKWVDDQTPEFFLYDFSGDQLQFSPTASGYIPYTGPKPFPISVLNTSPNTKSDRSNLSEYQQTIFDQIIYKLDYVDSTSDSTKSPSPLELFIGFNSPDEGGLSNTLQLIKREYVNFHITPNAYNGDVIQFAINFVENEGFRGIILLSSSSTSNFRQDSSGNIRGLKPGQILKISISDNMNSDKKYTSRNDSISVKILSVFYRYMVVEFIDRIFYNEFTQVDDYPSVGKTTYLDVNFSVLDKTIAEFKIFSETEIEDPRYKIELSNNGQLIDPYDTFIFKNYDIYEQGIDWGFLNRKRKEMLMVRDQIFPYIGSYKSIINAINFFGYNDLELYEYYRNILKKLPNGTNNPNYYKLFKVEIPDIFNNTIKGWNEKDYIKNTLPNQNFETTNLFNLTYNITNKDGDNVLIYSLSEVIIKLQGLKIWLERKIIPITHRIQDITGRTDFVSTASIEHRNYDVRFLNISEDFTPVDFELSEAYLLPINSGSTVYNCRVNFFIGVGLSSSTIPDYFHLKVRTYQTYNEWSPLNTYQIGDRISYYGNLYESVIQNNRIHDPRKYDNTPPWSPNYDYVNGQYSIYDREVYQYIATQSSFNVFGRYSSINPYVDILTHVATYSWYKSTEWKKIDLSPVQTLVEYRYDLYTFSSPQISVLIDIISENNDDRIYISRPYNFTIDSNLDPFITMELTSDNGFGQIYTTKKNYEIRGIQNSYSSLYATSQISPFVPISPVTNLI